MKRKGSSGASAATRKLSLYSEENDEAMVDLGDAIRSGDATYVFEMIETNNGIESSALSRRGLQFEITLRKETKAELLTSKSIREEERKSSHFYDVQDSIKIYGEKFHKADKV